MGFLNVSQTVLFQFSCEHDIVVEDESYLSHVDANIIGHLSQSEKSHIIAVMERDTIVQLHLDEKIR